MKNQLKSLPANIILQGFSVEVIYILHTRNNFFDFYPLYINTMVVLRVKLLRKDQEFSKQTLMSLGVHRAHPLIVQEFLVGIGSWLVIRW